MIGRHLALLVLVPTLAVARQPDGTLGIVRRPNNGVPALVLAGGTFDALLTERASLRLAGVRDSVELSANWTELPGGLAQARCHVPEDLPPGVYTIMADAQGRKDSTPRAVYVIESFPETYLVAHVANLNVGSHQRDADPAVAVMADVDASDPAFVLISGNLTLSGGLDQFRRVLTMLDACARPTFVCPGGRDRQSRAFDAMFGSVPYAFWFGKDGYLAFDTSGLVPAHGLGRHDAGLELLRRAIKPARWSVGFTHCYKPQMGMRSQVVLLIDNPLDALLCGHGPVDGPEGVARAPWGRTGIIVTPPGAAGWSRLIEVTLEGVRPQEAQRVAPPP